MHHNFNVANYGADGGCFDNDDGSSYYKVRRDMAERERREGRKERGKRG
jgi:hypothetical protein